MEELKNISTTQEIAETTNKKKSFKDLSPLSKNSLIAVIMVVITAVILCSLSAFKLDRKKEEHNLSEVKIISELSTVQCRYRNVAVYEKKGGILGVGGQYVWFEYDVIVDVGIDTEKVKIKEEKATDIIRIYLPPADIHSVIVDKETIKKPVCELAAFTEITADEESQIINSGLEKLRKDIKEEVTVYAYNSAKRIFEQYVDNLNKLEGNNYRIVWVDNPEDF